MSNPQQLVQKLWNYCNILRDDGLSYGELASQARHYSVALSFAERSRASWSSSSILENRHE